MCAPVVPATVASGHFEIVTKYHVVAGNPRPDCRASCCSRDPSNKKAPGVAAGGLVFYLEIHPKFVDNPWTFGSEERSRYTRNGDYSLSALSPTRWRGFVIGCCYSPQTSLNNLSQLPPRILAISASVYPRRASSRQMLENLSGVSIPVGCTTGSG